MAINREAFIRRDKSPLLFLSKTLLVIAILMVGLHFFEARVKDRSDILFINGAFEDQSWVSSGSRNGSVLNFHLQHYTNSFRIIADLYPELQREKFLQLTAGTPLTLGIAKSSASRLKGSGEVRVYSITADHETYLDLDAAIRKVNSPTLFYFAGISLLLAGVCLYFSKRVSNKVAIM